MLCLADDSYSMSGNFKSLQPAYTRDLGRTCKLMLCRPKLNSAGL